ncbi:hypothetical protein B5F40_12270 [Gordonibacter sp. An230]|uniref:ferric reductase-like transmembrane domain-containing protein n=1 Tax=Gordonibacter sp. An230 TaxID=1965592 RepID=UPI000B36C4C6|nr:ferric reductase-like transmembrane domain-containing protein [Gordonibacter sp. An230]OUO88626.1 hypothetical protein B5F40_12270 [Gordonibacter sp. An230]
MMFLAVFACTAASVLALKPVIAKAPAAWYALAAVLVALYLAGTQGLLPAVVKGAVFLLLQKGMLAVALFAVVMFVGVFSRESRVRRHLAPIRAELSIIACILICGHIVAYGMSYATRVLGARALDPFVAAGLAVGVALVVLLAVLGVTSLACVKARMSKRRWRRVQKWAYAFFALTYAHSAAMLLPSAIDGGVVAVQGVAAYTAVFGAYAVARVARAVIDGKRLPHEVGRKRL